MIRTEEIKDILEKSGADAWELTDVATEGWEFYFIRHRLDQNRIRSTRHTTVTVYKKNEDASLMGKASAEIAPTASAEEAGALVSQLLHEAGLVQDPSYDLNAPSGGEAGGGKGSSADVRSEVCAMAKDFIETMDDLPETATEDINSYEIFCNVNTRHFMNSNGIDVWSTSPASTIEVVANARKDGREIESYRMYHSGTCDRDALKRDLTETLAVGRDRLNAGKTPELGKCDVVFSTDAALEIYSWFAFRVSADAVYRKYSDWEPGKPVSDDLSGDRITLRALKKLDNSSRNDDFDAEGAPVRDMDLIEDGVVKAYWGSRKFSCCLGLEDSFIPGNWSAGGGKRSADEIRTGRYLEVVEFSDFQVNSVTGDIAGEIRLAYLHDGDSVSIVSGGSVSGSMNGFVKDMEFSREQRQYNNFLIPAVTRLKDVTVAGA
jgi:predicted Zn-dependent protease